MKNTVINNKRWFAGLLALGTLLAALPAAAQPLTGSGMHLPLPAVNSDQPDVVPVEALSSGGFTGTWSSPAAPPWIGTFSATGPFPDGSSSGITTFDFSGLSGGVLPAGTNFVFIDVDAGSGPGEGFELRAFDASSALITTPWLNQPTAVTSINPAELVPEAMPGWSFTPGLYTIDGNTVFTLNPNLTVYLTNNQPIRTLVLDKFTTNYGFLLTAPVVAQQGIPEPSTAALLGAGILGLLRFGRRRQKQTA